VSSGWARAALSHRIFTGIRRRTLGKLIAELSGPWMKAGEDRLRERRGHERERAPGASPDHDLPFTDRVIVTLVYLRFQLAQAALAELYRVHRSTITRAVREVRPLLAARGCAVPEEPGVRLRTLADVFAYAAAEGIELRIDGTEVQVRRPPAGKPGCRAFVSGKRKQNTKKATVITGPRGNTLWAGAFRPGRMHDQTAVRAEGIADLFRQHPQVRAKVDAGYRGLAREFPDQVQCRAGHVPGGNRPAFTAGCARIAIVINVAWDHNSYYHEHLLRALPARCGRVLDVGCGAGAFAARLAERADRVDALDRSPLMIAEARRLVPANVTCLHGDVTTADLPSGAYDAITSISALHHVDLALVLPRLAAALRPGGLLIAVSHHRLEVPRGLPADAASVLGNNARRAVLLCLPAGRRYRREMYRRQADRVKRMLAGLDMPSGRQPQARQAVITQQHAPGRTVHQQEI
jgi:SAM-dependent methyltransferase